MRLEEFEAALATYGSHLARWPQTTAEAAGALLARDAGARRLLSEAETLDRLLAATVAPQPVDAALIGRIVSGIDGHLHHQETVRPTGRLAAWAGVAMAVFLVAGFVIGLAVPSGVGDDDEALAGLMFGAGFAASVESLDGSVL
jgi:predicted phage tail protein